MGWSCTNNADTAEKEISKIIEEQFDLRNDSVIFKSATIENFDQNGRSIDVYWIDQQKDTVLRFYRKYDAEMQLIGAEYFEAGDTAPSIDSVFYDEAGHRVEASLNEARQIRWQSTIQTDDKGNEVLKTYANGKGEYRGFDSLYFDEQNRPVKGFYENSRGKRYGIKTYNYVNADDKGNWTEREMYVNDTLRQKHSRTLEYH